MIGEEKCTKFHFSAGPQSRQDLQCCTIDGTDTSSKLARILSHPRLKGSNLPNKRNFMTTSSEVPNNCNTGTLYPMLQLHNTLLHGIASNGSPARSPAI